MRPDRRLKLLLFGLSVAVAVAAYQQWPRATVSNAPSAAPRGVARPGDKTSSGPTAPDVRLESLTAERPSQGDHARNLFKFKPKPAPVAVVQAPQFVPPPMESVGPPPVPPPPPIPLKFIGILEPTGAAKVAVLSDGRGVPMHGREGDAVLGQYRILRINAESIEMSYLDGRGRQTIRLSGS